MLDFLANTKVTVRPKVNVAMLYENHRGARGQRAARGAAGVSSGAERRRRRRTAGARN